MKHEELIALLDDMVDNQFLLSDCRHNLVLRLEGADANSVALIKLKDRQYPVGGMGPGAGGRGNKSELRASIEALTPDDWIFVPKSDVKSEAAFRSRVSMLGKDCGIKLSVRATTMADLVGYTVKRVK